MRLLLIALLALPLTAQQATLTMTGPATVRPGATINANLSLSSPGSNLAGLQWSVSLPVGYTATASAGAASTAAGKTLYCNPAASLCLTVGVNQSLYAAGVVATYQIAIPSSAPAGSVTIPLSGLVAASLDAQNIPITAGPTYSVTVLSRFDLNGDGAVNIQDLIYWLQRRFAMTSTLDEDLNGDGQYNVLDAQAIARAVSGT